MYTYLIPMPLDFAETCVFEPDGGFRLFVCVGYLIVSLLSFLKNWSISEFLGVHLFSMVLSIIMHRDFHWLHSQVSSTFLVSF
jgi:hypothetical protein